jgi:hypothetical protein
VAGIIILGGSSSVTANTATFGGGGILNFGSVSFTVDWSGTVCGNDPDDWPGCQ